MSESSPENVSKAENSCGTVASASVPFSGTATDMNVHPTQANALVVKGDLCAVDSSGLLSFVSWQFCRKARYLRMTRMVSKRYCTRQETRELLATV